MCSAENWTYNLSVAQVVFCTADYKNLKTHENLFSRSNAQDQKPGSWSVWVTNSSKCSSRVFICILDSTWNKYLIYRLPYEPDNVYILYHGCGEPRKSSTLMFWLVWESVWSGVSFYCNHRCNINVWKLLWRILATCPAKCVKIKKKILSKSAWTLYCFFSALKTESSLTVKCFCFETHSRPRLTQKDSLHLNNYIFS